MRTVNEIVARKQQSIDCTEDESALIKAYFDTHHPELSQDGVRVAFEFPSEAGEWFDECERGDRKPVRQVVVALTMAQANWLRDTVLNAGKWDSEQPMAADIANMLEDVIVNEHGEA